MEVKSLRLRNFRNYSDETVEFAPRTNLIYGDNAQGKTNILEAVYMAANGRSHRAKSDSQMIKFGEEYAQISLEFADMHRTYKIIIGLLPNGKKSVKINNVPINKLSVLVNYLNVVMFSPEDLELVKGSPQQRRRFMDTAISSLSPRYMSELVSYHKALAQKNNLLRAARSGRTRAAETIDIWNMQLAASGVRIMRERSAFLKGIAAAAMPVHNEIAGCGLVLEYAPSIDEEILSGENAESRFMARLEEVKEREIENGSSLYGIQRDEIKFFVGGNEAKIYASQGQQRTIVLCLKLALTEYIKAKRDEYPVLLFDDIMSELDEKHRSYLAEKIRDKQVLLTCTDKEETGAAAFIHISNGRAECER